LKTFEYPEGQKIKVGFLFLDTMAHFYHAAPTAFELSSNPAYDVHLYISSQTNWNLLQELSLLYPDNQCHFNFVQSSLIQRWMDYFKKRPFPKIASVQKNHLKDFLSCDALVTTDKNMHLLNDHNKDHKILTFCLHHGPAHRDYVLSTDFAQFDCNLLGGNAAYNYMYSSGLFTKDQLRVVGYPKFDITLRNDPRKFFKNENLTVIYNPHDDPKISSWHTWGLDILDFFYRHPQYNLIFAPHIQLFAKQNISISEKYTQAKNIRVDLGSRASCDMSYTRSADIYLGDMSSQYYEFLANPKPCIFLNPKGVQWENDFQYRAWHLGDVIEKDNLKDLKMTLDTAQERHSVYKDKQNEIVNDVFYITDEPAAKRAAKVISEFLTTKNPSYASV
jgi:hypothetical protein